MANISAEQMNEVVQRVLGEVGQEARNYEKAFGVADLRNSVGELSRAGGLAAWTISYSTKSAEIVRGGEAAWTISYSTRSVNVERGQPAQ